jgi:hypothetical protein
VLSSSLQLQAATLALLSAACDRAARLSRSLPIHLSAALCQHLLEVQTLLSLRARFDPFTAAPAATSSNTATTAATAAATATAAAAAEDTDTVIANVPELEALAAQQQQQQEQLSQEPALTPQQQQQRRGELYAALLGLLAQCAAVVPAAAG